MKKIAILTVVIFALSAGLVYAADTGQTTSTKESGWQAVYDDISSWSWTKSSTASKTEAQPAAKAPAPKPEAKKRGTEVSVK